MRFRIQPPVPKGSRVARFSPPSITTWNRLVSKAFLHPIEVLPTSYSHVMQGLSQHTLHLNLPTQQYRVARAWRLRNLLRKIGGWTEDKIEVFASSNNGFVRLHIRLGV